jgi:hypothetical protein
MDKESFMKSIREGSQHVLIAERARRWRWPDVHPIAGRMAGIARSSHGSRPGRGPTRRTRPEVVSELRHRFAAAHVPSESMAWYLIDFKQAVDALDEYDIESGEPKSADHASTARSWSSPIGNEARCSASPTAAAASR